MSERELRLLIPHKSWCPQADYSLEECTCGLDKMLAETVPDVAVVLGILQKAYDDAVIVDERSIYYSLILAVEHHFPVRLTDDGWEYTDEPG